MANQEQIDLIRAGQGFIAALDQSGGSTPKALAAYGIEQGSFASDAEMYNLIHEMRARIVKSPDFTGQKVVGAILFADTMDRKFEGKSAPTYLWKNRGVVPFLKVDTGLLDTADDVQLLKTIPNLDNLHHPMSDLDYHHERPKSTFPTCYPIQSTYLHHKRSVYP